jgi:hypothetical protein
MVTGREATPAATGRVTSWAHRALPAAPTDAVRWQAGRGPVRQHQPAIPRRCGRSVLRPRISMLVCGQEFLELTSWGRSQLELWDRNYLVKQ